MIDWSAVDDPVERLHGFTSGFHATYYVYTGVECGLFESLVDPVTPSELAATLDLHPPYVRRFCEVGLRWGLLTVETDATDDAEDTAIDRDRDIPLAFRLRDEFVTPLGRPDAAQYMGSLFEFAAVHLGKDYVRYPTLFKTGETRRFENRSVAFTDVVEGTTRGLQTIFIEKLIPESLPGFQKRLSNGSRVLDIGCGTGHLARRLCNRYPHLEVIGVDLDADAIVRARERAQARGLDDRTMFHVADATSLSSVVTASVDAAVLFMSLHEIGADSREAVFTELGEVLGGDGVVGVFDEVYPETPEQSSRPPFANGVETQWSELVWGNEIPTASEQRDLLATAGLTERTRTTFADRFVAYEGGVAQ